MCFSLITINYKNVFLCLSKKCHNMIKVKCIVITNYYCLRVPSYELISASCPRALPVPLVAAGSLLALSLPALSLSNGSNGSKGDYLPC